MNILIVDDSEHFMALISDLTDKMGFKSYTADNGYEALPLIVEAEVDLLITDIEMPVMDGYRLTQIAREKGVQIIVMTGNNTLVDKTKAEVFGSEVCCIKDETLSSSLEEILIKIGNEK